MLAEGDRITAVDGEPIAAWDDIGPLVQRLGERGGAAMVEVERDGDRLALRTAARAGVQPPDGQDYWALGIALAPGRRPGHGRGAALSARWPPSRRRCARPRTRPRELFAMIGRAFTGTRLGAEHVAGPITIARASQCLCPAWARPGTCRCWRCCR